jgi:molybdate transport system ATP-binding protein
MNGPYRVLFVSHNQADVRRLADQVVVIAGGKLIAQGPPEQALAAPCAMVLPDVAGPQNVVRVERIRAADGGWSGFLGDAAIAIPQRDDGYGETAFVQFSPDAVILAEHDIADISVRNHLPGTVVQVVNTTTGVYVAVDVGAVIWAAVTASAAKELQLAPGRPVVCLIKTQSLQIW